MNRQEMGKQFYINDHALLFAVTARSILENLGQRGLPLVEKTVITYGRERGARMAMRCLRDGRTLDGKGYALYSEWADTKGWSKVEVTSLAPYSFSCTLCGWCSSWNEQDLLAYGRLYCHWVDHAIMYGFNPELELRMEGCLSQGDERCSFTVAGCHYKNEDEFKALMQEKKKLPPDTVKDFLYHCAHLYAAARRVLIIDLGVPQAKKIISKAMADYAELFSTEKALAIKAGSKQNFLEI